MLPLEKDILVKAYENYVSTRERTFTLALQKSVNGDVVNYRNAFRNLSNLGHIVLHFDNDSRNVNGLSLMYYDYEITDQGIGLIQYEMQK